MGFATILAAYAFGKFLGRILRTFWTLCVDEVSREEAAQIFLTRDVTFRYQPVIVEVHKDAK